MDENVVSLKNLIFGGDWKPEERISPSRGERCFLNDGNSHCCEAVKKVVLHCGVVFCTKCEKLTDPQNTMVHFSGSFQKCRYDFLRARL